MAPRFLRARISRPHPAVIGKPGTGSRAFEGRVLARQSGGIEDQGLAFDPGTVLTRRGLLGAFGLGAGLLALAACAPSGESTVSAMSRHGHGFHRASGHAR